MNETQNSHYDPLPDHRGSNSHSRDHARRCGVRRPVAGKDRLAEANPADPGRPRRTKLPHRASADGPLTSKVVFVNLPFHSTYHAALVEIVTGCVAHGLVPKIVTQQPGPNRLQRLVELIQASVFSIHDLSYLTRDRGLNGEPAVPRLNMPFELGLVLGDSLEHQLIVLERQRYSTIRSLSDLNGLDCRVYQSPGDIIAAIGDSLFTASSPDPKLMRRLHGYVTKASRQILGEHFITSAV